MVEQQLLLIVQPQPADVLCGRGRQCFTHAGNRQFRDLIGEHADTYKMAPTKKQKMKVVMLIADIIIARGGRFLIQNKRYESWSDGGKRLGKKKVGSALRDALRGRVKCMSQIIANNRLMEHSDDWSGIFSESSEESDSNTSDEMPPNHITVEPSKDWVNQAEMNVFEADDLLRFFLAESGL